MLKWFIVLILAISLIGWLNPLLRRLGLGRLPGPVGGFEPSCGRLGLTNPRWPAGPDDWAGTGAGTGELVRWIDGSDGTLGLEPLDRLGWLDRERTLLPLRL